MTEGDPVVVMESVSHAFTPGIRVLKDVSLTVRSGEKVAVVGPSGAGKSTLLRMINGLVTPTTGRVQVLGQCISDVPESARTSLRRQIGMVFQEFALVERLSVLTNVLIGRLAYVPVGKSLLRWFPPEDVALARGAIAEVGLAGLEDRQVRRLSGGQKQRVGIARAIVQTPRLLLADEPTANLDVRTSDEVLRLLLDVSRRHGATVVLNLHDVRAARRYCERIVGLRDGTVVWDGPASAFGPDEMESLFYNEVAAESIHPQSQPEREAGQ